MPAPRAVDATVAWWLVAAGSTALAAVVLSRPTTSTTPVVVLDVVVATAFLVAGHPDRRSPRGALVSSVGGTWLSAAVWPQASGLPVGLLLAVLAVLLPRGSSRLGGPVPTAAVVVIACLVAARLLPMAVVPFAAVALLLIRDRGGPRALARRWVASAVVILAVVTLLLSWDDRRATSMAADVRLAVLQVGLVAVAACLAAESAGRRRRGALVADLLLAEGPSGLTGLERELATLVGDPGLRLRRAERTEGSDPTRASEPPVVVDTASPYLADRSVREAVERAARLVLQNEALRGEDERRLAELEAARRELQRTIDDERASVRRRLGAVVERPLGDIGRELAALRDSVGGDAGLAVEVAAGQLSLASDEIAALVAGIPPPGLEDGRLAEALTTAMAASAVPVDLHVDAGLRVSADQATTVFYVCSEAVTNAVKHAGADRVSCSVRLRPGSPPLAVVRVQDEGRGGADPTGPGLQGLADRVASARGRLRVESPPGAGTVVEAAVPLS